MQLSNSKASVSRPISFSFLASLLKKALLPGPPARWEFIIVTQVIIAIRKARKGYPCRLCEMAPFIYNFNKAEASRIAAAVQSLDLRPASW